MEIGMGRGSVEWTNELLAIRDRSQAAMTAPPHGLHLAALYYPKHYGIANNTLFDKLLADARRYD
jgi:tRNA pseudouridine38-40 synthase